MIVLYILGGLLLLLLGLLLLLALLALIPVRARLGFREEFSLELRYLFLRFPLLPGEEEPEEPEEEPEKPEKPEGEKKPGLVDRAKAALKREGFAGFLQALGELLGVLAEASAGIVKRIRLRRFDLYLCVAGGEDAAAAAIRYGQVSAGVYAACGWLFGLLPCERKGVTVDLDYDGLENRVDFSAELSIRPIYVIKEALAALVKSRKPLKKIL